MRVTSPGDGGEGGGEKAARLMKQRRDSCGKQKQKTWNRRDCRVAELCEGGVLDSANQAATGSAPIFTTPTPPPRLSTLPAARTAEGSTTSPFFGSSSLA